MRKIKIKYTNTQRSYIYKVLTAYLTHMNASSYNKVTHKEKIIWSIVNELYPSFKPISYTLTFTKSLKYHEAFILNSMLASFAERPDANPLDQASTVQITNQIHPKL